MAKKRNVVRNKRRTHSHKTAKRLEVKRLMLEKRANKKRRK